MKYSQKILIQESATVQTKVNGMIKNDQDFLSLLANKLMLDELLCGEQEPVSFLIDMMKESAFELSKNNAERRLKQRIDSLEAWRDEA